MNDLPSQEQREKQRRWRLILGKDKLEQEAESKESSPKPQGEPQQGEQNDSLSQEDQALDEALDSIYGDEGGDGESEPDIARWLGDIHKYFPDSVVKLMQQDALNKYKFQTLLKNPEVLEHIEPDLNLASKLLAFKNLMPEETRASAREVVSRVLEDLKRKLEYPLLNAVQGSLNRSLTSRRPRSAREVHWLRTIHRNLKHYQPEKRTVIPETLIAYGKQRSSLHQLVLCVDQSASMGKSIIYSSIAAAVLASLPSLDLKLVLFDTNVVDMTDKLDDPVELLFGVQLRGGTNIKRAMTYCRGLVTRPRDCVFVLISDLFESGKPDGVLTQAAALKDAGVNLIVLLALDDEGTPRFNEKLAEELASLAVPSFACTPELFPELLGAALSGQELPTALIKR